MSLPANEETNITKLLQAWSKGDQSAVDQLYPLVEAELKKLARNRLNREGPGHPLQSTELIDLTFMRLIKEKKVEYQDRIHFYAVAARKMRFILIEEARKRPHILQVDLSDAENELRSQDFDLLALDEALKSLAEEYPRKSQVVELRFFGELNYQEIADVLKASESTVAKDWLFAKAWLRKRLGRR